MQYINRSKYIVYDHDICIGIPSALPPIRRTMTAPEPMNHTISHYTKDLHRQRSVVKPEALFLERIKALRKLTKIP